jgi:signal transduction histidine kinase
MKNKRVLSFIGILLAWTVLLVFVIIIEFVKLDELAEENALVEARANFNKDLAVRNWSALHGGVYVPVDSLTQPNPALSNLPERDIETPSGVKLTLMNPAYMMRELNVYFNEYYGITGHLTSLNLMRAKNKPDEWEIRALKQFDKGVKEVSEFTQINNEPYLRLMQPMMTTQSCLKCHAHQGYQVGDVRGGIGVSLPMNNLLKINSFHKERFAFVSFLIWLLGSVAFIFGYRRINQSWKKQQMAEKKLNKRNLELIKALDKATESDRLKSAFLANMSHEIRTPMNGIMGFTSMLKENGLSIKDFDAYISIIEQSGTRLLNIINDLLDISRIESGQVEMLFSDININELIEYMATFFKPEVAKKGIELSFKNSLPDSESIIRTDHEKIHAILINLVKNSIKYSHEGFIEIGYQVKDKYLEFYVKDTGIGIEKEVKAFIFERFRQANDSNTRKYEGAGLGLSITKAYVEMLGGEIWVESEFGKGSVFYFTIPYHSSLKDKSLTECVSANDAMIF